MAHQVRETVLDGHDALELCAVEREIVLTLVPGAGMVGASLTHEGRELLHRGDGLAAWTEHGRTFGIPLLHPWANRLERLNYEAAGRHVLLDPARMPVTFDGAGLPIHGLLHASPRWTVEHTHADGGGVTVSARYDAAGDAALLAGFPFPHMLDLTVSLRTDLLTWSLTLTATGDVPVPVSFGLASLPAPARHPTRGLEADAPARPRAPAGRARHPDRADAAGAVHVRPARGPGVRRFLPAAGRPAGVRARGRRAARCVCASRRATAVPRCTRRRVPTSSASSR